MPGASPQNKTKQNNHHILQKANVHQCKQHLYYRHAVCTREHGRRYDNASTEHSYDSFICIFIIVHIRIYSCYVLVLVSNS